jgi:hypothetical protein
VTGIVCTRKIEIGTAEELELTLEDLETEIQLNLNDIIKIIKNNKPKDAFHLNNLNLSLHEG